MEMSNPFVFQVDSDMVQKIYRENSNYLIEYSDNCSDQEYCTIYFCSHNIYYPNTEDVFKKRIVEKDFYEWYNTRIEKSHKHIFVRDIFKQWYVAGINSEINSPEKLLDWLNKETQGYKIITIGSSAGGYAAILYGSLLNVDQVMAFNPQFEVKSLLNKSNENTDPLLFRLKDSSVFRYYDIHDTINEKIDIYYFYSNQSVWDIQQCNHIQDLDTIHRLSFHTTHHGIPFPKTCISKVLNLSKVELNKLSGKKDYNPIVFSIKMIGFFSTVVGLIIQSYKAKRR